MFSYTTSPRRRAAAILPFFWRSSNCYFSLSLSLSRFSPSQPLPTPLSLSRSLDAFFLGQCPVDVWLSTLNNLEKFLSSSRRRAWAVRQSEWSICLGVSPPFLFSPSLTYTDAVFSLCTTNTAACFLFLLDTLYSVVIVMVHFTVYLHKCVLCNPNELHVCTV